MQANFENRVFLQYLQGLIDSPGDLLLHCGDHKTAPMQDIARYRDLHYASRNQDYLLSEAQREFENVSGVDRRSQHLWITRRGQIVGTMRVTPPPYELMFLAPPDVLARGDFSRRLEFGRLVSSASGDDVGVISKRLIAGACLFGVKYGYEGVIAACKSPQRRLFERFGLTAIPPQFVISERNHGQYWLVQASWREIIDAIPAADYQAAAFMAEQAEQSQLTFTE